MLVAGRIRSKADAACVLSLFVEWTVQGCILLLWRATCPFADRLIAPGAYPLVHVVPLTFQQLVVDWLAEFSIGFDAIEITPPADNQYVAEMTDAAQVASWRRYHQKHAVLRLLSPIGNLSVAKKNTRV